MKNEPILLIRLEGPMQSWGLKAKWDIRDSGEEPSKSGIVGLFGCALGYSKYDPRLADELEAKLRIGVRIESGGSMMKDFHTITGVLHAADGSKRGKQDEPYTVISERYYLQDAAFLVAVEGPENLLIKIHGALKKPRWPIYLGRKSCPPTRPILDCLSEDYESIEDALKHHPWSALSTEAFGRRPTEQLPCILEEKSLISNDNESHIRTDKIQNSPVRMYGLRRVRVFKVNVPTGKEGSCTFQD